MFVQLTLPGSKKPTIIVHRTTEVNQTEAAAACAELGMNLAWLNNDLALLTAKKVCGPNNCWIGELNIS